MTNVQFALSLTIFAGLSTGIGSLFAFVSKKTDAKFLSVSLGFSAGVMLYVSFIEIFQKARFALGEVYGMKTGTWLTVAGFFGGMFLIAMIDKLVPSYENPHEIQSLSSLEGSGNKAGLMRMGILSALAITIHNFPEGLATFASAMKDPTLGVSIAIAIAIHNIPEGIAVSVPIYYATGSKKKAFIFSFLSGLSEPVGAVLGYFLLRTVFNDVTFGIIFASVAGIMVYISLDQLLPTAEEYGEHHLSIYGLVSGMILMALSLLLFMN
ncbi:MAG: zinc transporter ZupT [Candidatus Cloacimonetes bacterium]|nr:zinc transporter ZupT [Candidatus Cloacimonadota bacterium]